MKLRISSSVILLLLPAITTTLADESSDAKDVAVAGRDTTGATAAAPDIDEIAAKTSFKGTQGAPIDGKDGRPHAGPWVETSAERDRKNTDVVTGKTNTEPAYYLDTNEKSIPSSNNGVMDDRNRAAPKAGTRGTEAGVSGKSTGNTYTGDKSLDSPKAAPPLPHSEEQKLPATGEDSSAKGTKGSSTDSTLGVLEKPADLPNTPHDLPLPKSPTTGKSSPVGLGKDGSSTTIGDELPEGERDAFHSLLFSFTMIVVSEIGDKTFLVAALMAMRHPRLLVFSAAFSALIGMTVVSAVLGHAVPTLIPKTFTKFLAAVLFFVFGAKMLKEGREMSPDEGVGEEMREVEQELEEKEHEQLRMSRRRSSVTPHALESGRLGRKPRSSANRLPSPPESLSSSSSRGSSPRPSQRWNDLLAGMNNLFSLLLSPAWVQTFVMTFLGEWGDRSQIATIAMAAGQDYWFVTVGAITGHGLCTAAAVIGGSAIAGKVSMRVVTLGGAVAFLVFGAIYLLEAFF
ncbi:TMEM165/GDT1 family protein [Aspergillus undulatus]|uniref:TMEM165/GDT1 family protein n=1 Tax=Aspergillus undulatus TaxID=1810928 RepID=UPI003CCD2AA1